MLLALLETVEDSSFIEKEHGSMEVVCTKGGLKLAGIVSSECRGVLSSAVGKYSKVLLSLVGEVVGDGDAAGVGGVGEVDWMSHSLFDEGESDIGLLFVGDATV